MDTTADQYTDHPDVKRLRLTADNVEDEALISALKQARLDVDYWLNILKIEWGVTAYEQLLKFSDGFDFQKLERFVRDSWEIEALKEIVCIHDKYPVNAQQRDHAQKREQQCNQVLGALVSLQNDGKTRSNIEVIEREVQLRQTLEIPDDIWIKTCTGLSLGGLIDNFRDQLGEMASEIPRNELSTKEFLEQTSNGLALKGILVTNNVGECAHVRETVIDVPNGVTLKQTGFPQKDGDLEHISQAQTDQFSKSIQTLGYSIATSESGLLKCDTAAGSLQTSKQEQTDFEPSEQENYVAKVKYCYVPTASYELEKGEMKLCKCVLNDLKELEGHLEGAGEKHIQDMSEEFLKKYGSHVNSSAVLGGLYMWHAGYHDKVSFDKEKSHSVINDALGGLALMSYSGLGIANGGSMRGDQVTTDLDTSYDDAELSKVTLTTTRIGGLQNVTCLPLWKLGLFKSNASWAVIDRGSSLDKDVVGIWELIQNSRTEFSDAGKVAGTLQEAWQRMIGLTPVPPQTKDEIKEAPVSVDDFIEGHVQEWSTDEEHLSINAVRYLEQLIECAQQCCSEPDGIELWVRKLDTDTTLNDFLKNVIKIKEDYSHSDIGQIYNYLKIILNLVQGHDFPLKNEINQFFEPKEYIPDIMLKHMIQNVGSLIIAIKETLLPAMDADYAKRNCPDEVDNSVDDGVAHAIDQIDVKATKDLEMAVGHLQHVLEKADEHYEMFFLQVAVHKMKCDFSDIGFKFHATKEILFNFTQELESCWEEFLLYKEAGVMEMQAFLIQFLILSLPESSKYREQHFQKLICRIKNLLTSDIVITIARYISETRSNWDGLLATLGQLKKGNISILQYKAIDIPALDGISKSKIQKDSDETSECTTLPIPHDSTHIGKLLVKLGLTNHYPSKISLQDVMAVRSKTSDEGYGLQSLPWHILQKLIMLDYNARESEPRKVILRNEEESNMIPDSSDNDGLTFDSLLEDLSSEEEPSLNPLDVFLTIYFCCDMVLKQTLVNKMFICRLAVPFICPQPPEGSLLYSLWALRSIIVEWRNKDQVCMETSVVSQPVKIVSFLRIRKPSCSKSILINHVLSNQAHHTFWNRDCPLGNADRTVANGLVEAQWYIPSGKATDAFEDVTMFLNLRGDALEFKKQVNVLHTISNVVVCCFETTDLGDPEVLQMMKDIHDNSSKVILLLAAKDPTSIDRQTLRNLSEQYLQHIGKSNMANAKSVSGIKGDKVRTTEDLKQELRSTLHKLLSDQTGKSIEESCTEAMMTGIEIDEDEDVCREGKRLANEVISCMNHKSTNECKAEMLPLQGGVWQEWSKLLKHRQNSGWKGMCDTIHEISQIEVNMTQLRQDQLESCKNLSELMKMFLQNLVHVIDSPTVVLYLQWIKIYLDEKSRNTLPGLHREYHKKWLEFSSSTSNEGNATELKKQLKAAEKLVADASFGIEHLLREIAQIYEAAVECKLELTEPTRETIDQLPSIAAKMLLKGQPIEIMDGDAASVPLTWIKALFSRLTALVGDKMIFVISVLGIQSSGKSTLLNTMFGLQFAVSAGRCTRGVYMQLIKVDKERSDLSYDYVLVIDTEGLRAPELGQLKHNNDNQLATFVIGLGDVTILNIKGENVAEVSDVLQIAVHAFLRMKIVNKNFQLHRTCVFIHQNVPAVNAKEKMQRGCQKLKECLDEMTREASAIENIVDIHTFNEVIKFDGETNVWYFSDLWHGDPPMAPANPGYSEKVQEVKDSLLNDLSQKQEAFLTFSDMRFRVEDLWKGVLSEDFVFSFRNSLAAKAYNHLESVCYAKSWDVENSINEWITQEAIVHLERCSTKEELESGGLQLLNELHSIGNALRDSALSGLEHFFQTNNMKDILIEWKTPKTETLKSDTNLFILRAEKVIEQRKDNLMIDRSQKSRLAETNNEIMKKAKQLAEEMKGKVEDESALHEIFDKFWMEREKEYAKVNTPATVPIERTVELLLYKRLGNASTSLQQELQRSPSLKPPGLSTLEGSIMANDIVQSHISVQKSVKEKVLSQIPFRKPQEFKSKYKQAAADISNHILSTVDIYLKDVSKEDSDFQELYATNVIKKVVDGIQQHNQNTQQTHFTILPNLMVKIAVHACRFAVTVFKRMQSEYHDNHSIERKLAAFKNAAWSLFSNTVNQCTIEVIAADLLSNHLEVLVKQAVRNRMTGEIVNHVVRYFSHTKFHLIVRILRDLAEGPFDDYRKFISDSRDFTLSWITSFTDEEIFTSIETTKSRYVCFVGEHSEKLAESIRRSIRATTEVLSTQTSQGASMNQWVKTLCSRLHELPIKEEDMKPMVEQNVENFDYLEELLNEKVKGLVEQLLAAFTSDRAENIKWEGETPYKQILNRLWGCEAQCPFCAEVCQRTDPNHLSPNDSHQCIQHRPSGVNGVRNETSKLLCVESCNFDVQSDRIFGFGILPQLKHLTEIYHPYKEYKKFLPDWDIAPSPNMESSKYWMWFMAKYKNELAERYKANAPEIPAAWHQITKQEALDSLCVYQK